MSHGEAPPETPVDILQQDRDRYAAPVDPDIEIVGVDPEESRGILCGGRRLLDAGVATNFEKRELAAQDVTAIESADLIISTGCVGYVTEISLELLDPDNGTWMAHCSGAGNIEATFFRYHRPGDAPDLVDRAP